MPQERENPYPDFKPGDITKLKDETTREQLAARCVATRKFGGIPKAAFMRGDNDEAPMIRGVTDLTTVCYKLLDAIDKVPVASIPGFIIEARNNLRAILEDPGK